VTGGTAPTVSRFTLARDERKASTRNCRLLRAPGRARGEGEGQGPVPAEGRRGGRDDPPHRAAHRIHRCEPICLQTAWRASAWGKPMCQIEPSILTSSSGSIVTGGLCACVGGAASSSAAQLQHDCVCRRCSLSRLLYAECHRPPLVCCNGRRCREVWVSLEMYSDGSYP